MSQQLAPHYDAAVIGSSPLMLMIAIEETRAGKRVCVLDRSDGIGGMWRSVHIAGEADVEYACHLIEDFPGVYEYLEATTDLKFEALDVQPVRVLRNGLRVRYSSRKTLLAAAIWAAGLIGRYRLKQVFINLGNDERERLAILEQKLSDFFRHHLGVLVRGSVVKAPTAGYAEFIRALESGCKAHGVAFSCFDVRSVTDDGARWTLADAGGRSLSVDEIHATTSATLVSTNDNGFTALTVRDAVTHSVLVEVPLASVREPVSYAAFWKDPDVVRVSRIDRREPRTGSLLYLVQLRKSALIEENATAGVVERCLTRAGIVSDGGVLSVIGEIRCSHAPHSSHLPPGVIARRFRTYPSAGNLASGVARWLAERRTRSVP